MSPRPRSKQENYTHEGFIKRLKGQTVQDALGKDRIVD